MATAVLLGLVRSGEAASRKGDAALVTDAARAAVSRLFAWNAERALDARSLAAHRSKSQRGATRA
jgi:hypothetical protein